MSGVVVFVAITDMMLFLRLPVAAVMSSMLLLLTAVVLYFYVAPAFTVIVSQQQVLIPHTSSLICDVPFAETRLTQQWSQSCV